MTNRIKPLLKISLAVYALLLCAVWFFYPEFTACSKDSVWCSIAYWTTESAGKIGTLFIVTITSTLYAISLPSIKEKVKIFLKTFLVLSILLSAFAFLNEHLLKPAVKLARPSHIFMIKQTHSRANLDSLYTLEEVKRKTFFQELLASDTLNFKSIDVRILDHWVEEDGYSFPSGHSFNAFLLASILTFSIYQVEHKKIRLLCFLPLAWAFLVALSRVAVGAHSAMDVSVGAGVGLILSHALLGVTATRDLIVPKKRI